MQFDPKRRELIVVFFGGAAAFVAPTGMLTAGGPPAPSCRAHATQRNRS
jgi:hypothetical protein